MNLNTNDFSQHKLGFRLLQKTQSLKIQLAESGPAGMQSFIIACITIGIDTDEAIFEKAADILGPHGWRYAQRVFQEGINTLWQHGPNDQYTVI